VEVVGREQVGMVPSNARPEASRTVPRLGVGLAYQTQLRPFIERRADAFDFLEVVPDILWTDLGRDARPRYVDDAEGLAFLSGVATDKPIIPHSIGLSIGSAHRFDREHIVQMERWYQRFPFPWHSDHSIPTRSSKPSTSTG
jgi:uncharacterized protein (UPF0276 family)